jgi:hypothetical protein
MQDWLCMRQVPAVGHTCLLALHAFRALQPNCTADALAASATVLLPLPLLVLLLLPPPPPRRL